MIQVINRLSQAKRISIYGTGISYTIASQAAFKIMTLGKECDAHSGINYISFYHKKIVVNV